MNLKQRIFWKKRRLQEAAGEDLHPLENRVQEWINKKLYTLWKDKLERELFHSCVLLKNLAIVHQELPLSTDYILEQLMEAGKPLRNTYADILTLYRKGDHDQAFRILGQRIPTKAAQDFSRILSKIDYIQPAELVMQMDGFEETFSAERMTKAMARADRKSLVTTLVSTATIFVVLLNFTIVVIFLDTLHILGQLF